jgi:hypothetical protein
MSLQVILRVPAEKPSVILPFPKLMRLKTSPEHIILFKQSKVGTVVNVGGTWPLGYYYFDWVMEFFEDVEEGTSITLVQ